MDTNVALVVLVGLPGAGKSTLCKTIVAAAEKKPELKSFYFVHVCYDTFIPLTSQEKYVEARKNGTEEELNCWKAARHDVYLNVERLVICLKTNTSNSSISSLFNIQDQGGKFSNYVILLDDNFYYRSMRYEYYQLARKYTVGFTQVLVDCNVDIAVEQNLKRTVSVPTAVVYNMAQKFQPPKPKENSWEAASIVVPSHNLTDLDGLLHLIQESILSPVLPVENNELEKEESRLICSCNVAHQADLFLRSHVGNVIKEVQRNENMKGKDLSAYASLVNTARQSVLVSVRKGLLLFPPHLAEVVNDNNRDHFERFIASEFQKYL